MSEQRKNDKLQSSDQIVSESIIRVLQQGGLLRKEQAIVFGGKLEAGKLRADDWVIEVQAALESREAKE